MVGTEAIVVRVTRPDTIMIRSSVPQLQSMITHYLVLEGVNCNDEAKAAIVDWCEVHQEGGRFRLLNADWFRDSFGRLLGDLQDLSTGETLTDSCWRTDSPPNDRTTTQSFWKTFCDPWSPNDGRRLQRQDDGSPHRLLLGNPWGLPGL